MMNASPSPRNHDPPTRKDAIAARVPTVGRAAVRNAQDVDVLAGEVVESSESAANPDVAGSTDLSAFRIVDLETLVRIKFTASATRAVSTRDRVAVGLVDHSWPAGRPPVLSERSQLMLDTADR